MSTEDDPIPGNMRVDYERRLTQSLVVLARRERQYRTDAHFKHSVDILVRLLPFWVTGIGLQAEEERAGQQALMEEHLRTRPLFSGPGDFERLQQDLGLKPRDVDGLIIEPGTDPLA